MTKQSTIYFIKRILPFMAIYLWIEFVLRLVLTIKSYGLIEAKSWEIISVFFQGMVQDIFVFIYFLLPYILYLILLPSKLHLKKVDKIITYSFLYIIVVLLIFDSLAEYIYWNEYSARFSYSAEFSNEFISKLLGPLNFIIILILSTLIYFVMKAFLIPSASPEKVTIKARLLALLSVVWKFAFIFLLAHFGFSIIAAPKDKYLNELSKNGIHSLFAD